MIGLPTEKNKPKESEPEKNKAENNPVANVAALKAIRAIVTYEICLALTLSPTKEQINAYKQHSPDWKELKKELQQQGQSL